MDSSRTTTGPHSSKACKGRLRREFLHALLAVVVGGPAAAAPAASHWTVIDLGSLGGTIGYAYGVNSGGQVVGYSAISGNASVHAFLYSNGAMTDLGTLGGIASYAYGINSDGQVVGFSGTGGGAAHAFLYGNGTLVDLGTLGGTDSYGNGINDSGVVTGYGVTGAGPYHALLYSGGTKTDLGTLGGSNSYGNAINNLGQVTGGAQIKGDAASHAVLYSGGAITDLGSLGGNESVGNGINNAGQVTGYSSTAGEATTHAFLYSKGVMSDLGTLGGLISIGSAINSAGLVTGYATTSASAFHAFLYSNGVMRDLNSFNGIAGGSLTLTAAYGINDAGQVVGEASVVGGIKSRPFLATLDTVVWENRFGGNWDGTDGWSAGIKPNANTAVFLDPAASLTVTGPAGAVTVKTLNIGGDASGNNGNATLNLAGSAITVTGNAGSFTTVSAKGVLSGDGLITGPVTNLGTVDATNLSLPGGLSNAGTVAGKGRLTAAINNLAGGTVRVAGGERLNLIGNAGNASGGTFDLSRGGELQVNGTLTNNLGGRLLLADGSRLGVSGGLTNNGQLLMSYGTAELFGNIVTNSGGKLILSGTSNTVFYDAVDIKSGGELRVSAGSTATFFGLVSQRTGSLFTGTGTKFYEGGLRIGASPGLGIDEGNVSLGAGNLYLEELGGIDSGTGYDAYHVTGQLSLGGTLKLVSWQGFTAQAGQQFDLFDWGSVSGAFDSIDTSGLLLADGTRLDVSRLYVDGSISVSAVPEPGTWALMCCGLAVPTLCRRYATRVVQSRAALSQILIRPSRTPPGRLRVARVIPQLERDTHVSNPSPQVLVTAPPL